MLRAGAAHHLHALAHQNRTEFGRPLLSLAVFNGWSTWRDDLSTGVVHAVRAAVSDALGGEAPATATDELLPTLEAAAEAVDGDVMLVLDQFEEYFVYRPNDTGAESFAEEFVAMVNATSLPVSVLVSIRKARSASSVSSRAGFRIFSTPRYTSITWSRRPPAPQSSTR